MTCFKIHLTQVIDNSKSLLSTAISASVNSRIKNKTCLDFWLYFYWRKKRSNKNARAFSGNTFTEENYWKRVNPASLKWILREKMSSYFWQKQDGEEKFSLIEKSDVLKLIMDSECGCIFVRNAILNFAHCTMDSKVTISCRHQFFWIREVNFTSKSRRSQGQIMLLR